MKFEVFPITTGPNAGRWWLVVSDSCDVEVMSEIYRPGDLGLLEAALAGVESCQTREAGKIGQPAYSVQLVDAGMLLGWWRVTIFDASGRESWGGCYFKPGEENYHDAVLHAEEVTRP